MSFIIHFSHLQFVLVGLILFESFCPGQEPRQETLERIKQLPGLSANANQVIPLNQQNPDVGELELVRKYPKPETLTLSTVQSFFYTDNVFLTETNARSSLAWNGQIGLNFVPYSTYHWTPRLGIEQYLVRYDRESSQDFEGQVVSLSSRLDLTEDKAWFWDASLSLTRLNTGRSNLGEFYRQTSFNNSLAWFTRMSPALPLYFLGAGDISWRKASPGVFDRLDYGLTFNLIYYPHARVSLQPFFRPAFQLYTTDTATERNRHDLNLSTGLSAGWTPCRNVSLSGAVSWTRNYSSAAGNNYAVTVPAISVFASIGF